MCSQNPQRRVPKDGTKSSGSEDKCSQMGQVPRQEPRGVEWGQIKKTFHLLLDDLDVLHHVFLHKGQMDILESYHKDQNREQIQLIQYNWTQYIYCARGRKKTLTIRERKSSRSRSNSIDSSKIKDMFQTLEDNRNKQQTQLQPNREERLSDQESQQSLSRQKKLMASSQVASWTQYLQSELQAQLQEILAVEQALKEVLNKQDCVERGTFLAELDEEGLRSLFIGMESPIYEYTFMTQRKNGEYTYQTKGAAIFEQINDEIIKKIKFIRAQDNNQIDSIVKEYEVLNDIVFQASLFGEQRLVQSVGIQTHQKGRTLEMVQDGLRLN